MSAAPSRRRRLAGLAVRIAVTAAALAWVFSMVEVADLAAALARASPLAFAVAIALTAGNVLVGTIRWRALLGAYGAARPPSLGRLARLYLVGFFYNTYLPGAVSGDVVRGIATREAFGDAGSATGSLAVVLVERSLGISGLLLLVTGIFTLHRPQGVPDLRGWGLLGMAVAACAITALAAGHRLARFLPRRAERVARAIPPPRAATPFAFALALSLVSHAVVALTGHVLASSLDSRIAIADSLVVVPVAAAAGYFPITVEGAGAREAAFVALYGTVGLAPADALAASLLLLASQLVVAGAGGVLNLLRPIERNAT